jgi:hypothetical protein
MMTPNLVDDGEAGGSQYQATRSQDACKRVEGNGRGLFVGALVCDAG